MAELKPGTTSHAFERDFHVAAVCDRGHVATRHAEMGAGPPHYCGTCGADVRITCRNVNCKALIPGQPKGVSGGKYTPPAFCMACGQPFPWLDRQGRLYLLQNRLLREDLDPSEALALREQFEALSDPDLDEDEQVRRWRRIADGVPEFWMESGARDVFVQVTSQGVRALLGWT